MSDEVLDYPRHDDVYVTIGLLKTELDRLRAENERLREASKRFVLAHYAGTAEAIIKARRNLEDVYGTPCQPQD